MQEHKEAPNHVEKPTIVSNSSGNSSLPPPNKKAKSANNTVSYSTSKLLSVNYNPSHNPQKDELVQTASIKILEVESLLDKLDTHVTKHHRKHSRKLQDFEQIHSELSKIQSTLHTPSDSPTKSKKPSIIDPFIVIAPSNFPHSDDDDDTKDDEKGDTITETVRNDKLPQLEPFQNLVKKIQKEIDPNITSSDSDFKDNDSKPRKNSIKVKKSELESIQNYVDEHRHKMKEKAIQYEEKQKQLQSAKDRLAKTKQRFRKRLNKSKQRTQRNRARAQSDYKKVASKSQYLSDDAVKPINISNTIDENSDVESNEYESLSDANLSKFHRQQARPRTRSHFKNNTNTSVQSSFSVISDQSFVEDFHSITAELENIDLIVRQQVKSPSMTSIFSDLGAPPSPKQNKNAKSQSTTTSVVNGDDHIQNNLSSLSGSDTKNLASYSVDHSENRSLPSDLYQVHDIVVIENQIGDM